MLYKTFTGKALFQSYVFKRTESLLPGKLAQIVSNKNGSCCNHESHCSLLHRQNNNKSCHIILHLEVDTWCVGTQLCETALGGNYILMTNFGPGTSEWLKLHLRSRAMRLVIWLVQLSSHMICLSKVMNMHLLSRILELIQQMCLYCLCAWLLIGLKKNTASVQKLFMHILRFYTHLGLSSVIIFNSDTPKCTKICRWN